MKSMMIQIRIYFVAHFVLSQILMGMTQDLQEKQDKGHYGEKDQIVYKFLSKGRDLFLDPVVDQALEKKGHSMECYHPAPLQMFYKFHKGKDLFLDQVVDQALEMDPIIPPVRVINSMEFHYKFLH